MKGLSKTAEADWQHRMHRLLGAIATIQSKRHTTSMRELAVACRISRQTIVVWLRRAEELGFVDRHDGEPRALELLPLGKLTLLSMNVRKRPKAKKVRNERADVAAVV